MDTSRSDKKVQEYLSNTPTNVRKHQKYGQVYHASIDKVFPQLCPTREYDWVDKWTCDLLFTSTGYAEKDCIFSTSENNIAGKGLWIFSDYVINERVQIIRLIENDIVLNLRIELHENDDNTTTAIWDFQFTGVSEKGNQIVKSLPDTEPFQAEVIKGLDHFLTTGKLYKVNF